MRLFSKETPGIIEDEIHPGVSSYLLRWERGVSRVAGLEAIKKVYDELQRNRVPADEPKKLFPPGIEIYRLGKKIGLVGLAMVQFDPPGIDELMDDLVAFETRVNTPFADFGIGQIPGEQKAFIGVMSGVNISKAIARLMVATNPGLYVPREAQLRSTLNTGLTSFPSLQPLRVT